MAIRKGIVNDEIHAVIFAFINAHYLNFDRHISKPDVEYKKTDHSMLYYSNT